MKMIGAEFGEREKEQKREREREREEKQLSWKDASRLKGPT